MWKPCSPLLAVVLASISLGCSPSSDGQAAVDQAKPLVPNNSAVEPEPASASESDDTSNGSDTDELAIEAVIEIDAPTTAPNTVPTSPASPTPITLSWREVATFPAPLAFVYIQTGVLARGAAGYYDLDDAGQLAPRAGLELPSGELLGDWPTDAWLVTSTQQPIAPGQPLSFEHEVMQLDADRRWVTRELRNQARWIAGAHVVRKGAFGTVLVREGSKLTRVGGKDNPKTGPRMGKLIVDVIETRAGSLYNISERPNGIYVQINCSDRDCVDDNAKKLPHGSLWSFSTQVLRQTTGVSVVATVDREGAVGHHLLHYERGNWKLESLLHPPTGLWPADDGGLWVLGNGKLMHRDSQGVWHTVAAPEGASSISAAMLPDRTELWVAATVKGKGVVFATSASPPT
ncbi:hypothetical protein [Enhygromyxa salina]|uniref:Lipoprotein n=1 Tax=Enhygromyxa salina TaxID=215803 RepID=A0A2S9Y811_9BACT|nr:hypothetical protein [Enhygromyxa salina]PRQ01239.1 hypothetical protein ENSA7_58440 [Enhygromyxa salina]